jgi:LacI family transcriptional regulator
MTTIKDLASKTGLGLATISKYLNGGNVREKNRLAIESAISELGFTVNELARGLRTSKSRIVGIVIPELGNLFTAAIVTVAEDILRRSGYGAIICDCGADKVREAEAVEFLLAKRVDGLINMPASGSGDHLLPAIEADIPILLLDRMIPDFEDKASAVVINNVEASATATRLLAENGHTRIGILLGPEDVFTASQRHLGYRLALEEKGIEISEGLENHGPYTVEAGYQAALRILKEEKPTALFATSYDLSLGAIIAINELGLKIREDVSLVCFDNIHLARVVKPCLTLVSQPMEEMGRAAAESMLKALGGDKTPRKMELQARLEIGESVRRLFS